MAYKTISKREVESDNLVMSGKESTIVKKALEDYIKLLKEHIEKGCPVHEMKRHIESYKIAETAYKSFDGTWFMDFKIDLL